MKCSICESTRCGNACHGRPGYVYMPTGRGWYPYHEAVTWEFLGGEVHWHDVWSYSKYGLVPEKDRIVILDTETAGLLPEHDMIEVAWAEVGGPVASAIVEHSTHHADPEALIINRYNERNLSNPALWSPKRHGLEDILSAAFEGATIMGSNVPFDQAKVTKWMADRFYYQPRWHHRPLEIGSFAAGFFGERRSLSLDESVRMTRDRYPMSVIPDPDHTAAGDVRTVDAVWRTLTQ